MNNNQPQDVPMASLQPAQPKANPVAPSAPKDQLDPSVVNLAKSIRDVENPTQDPNKTGASGEWGLYQYKKDTWDADNKKYGLNYQFGSATPQQQNEVAYKKFSDLKSQGYNVGQIASIHNSGKPDWTGNVDKDAVVPYDTPAYVDKVNNNYQAYKAGKTPEKANTSQPEAQSNEGGDVFSKIGNFLFPIVGDVMDDVKGKSKKTGLQQFGDFALSALPFIPGLGEAGEGIRGLAGAAELGGEAVARTGAEKILGSTVRRGALTGYGAGVASNLSQGKKLGESFAPDINTIGGAVLGGAAPAVLKGLGGLADKVSGIDPVVFNELKKLGLKGNAEDVKLYNSYINAAKTHATSISSSVENMAADNLDIASKVIDKKSQDAGTAVGVAKDAGSTIPVDKKAIAQSGKNFADKVLKDFGLNLTSDETGKVTAVPDPNSYIKIQPSDQKRIEDTATLFNKLFSSGKATVKDVSDVIGSIDKDLNYNKKPYGQGMDTLDGLMTSTRGDLNHGIVRPGSSVLATANDRFKELSDLQGTIRELAGNRGQRGELLMNRVLGNRSADSISLFNRINKETGIDLTKHAIMAQHAIQSVGSKADKSALQKIIEGATGNDKVGMIKSALQFSAKKLGANPEKIGRNLVSGKGSSLRNSLITKGAIEGSRFLKSILER